MKETDMALFNIYDSKTSKWLDIVAAPTLEAATVKDLKGRTDLKVVENTPIVFIWPEAKS